MQKKTTTMMPMPIAVVKVGQNIYRLDQDYLYGVKLFYTDPNSFGEGDYIYIEYRNSSNGYYGGSLDRIDEIPSEEILTEVNEDF